MLVKADASRRYKEAHSKAAQMYKIAKQNARKQGQGSVVAGTLKRIIDEAETDNDSPAGKIKKDTFRTRVDRGNITGLTSILIRIHKQAK